MGFFNFGGSTSRTDSSSLSRSNAGSTAGGYSVSGDQVAFEDIFAQLFGGASGAAAGLDPSMLTNAANTLFSGGMGFLGQLGSDAGTQYLEGRLGGDNEVLQEQIDLLGQDLGSFFREELNPAITAQAVGGGQLGGGRQGVAQGMATQQVGDLFTQGATALRAGDIAARDTAAQGLAQNSIQGAMAGLGGLSTLGGISQMGFGAEMAPYQLLAGILGDPTVLGSSSAADFANSFSNSFSTANSRTRGKAFKVGFGGT